MGKRAGQPGATAAPLGVAPVRSGIGNQGADTQETQQQDTQDTLVQPETVAAPPAASRSDPGRSVAAPRGAAGQELPHQKQSVEQPQKRVKKEPPQASARQRELQASAPPPDPVQKRPRQQQPGTAPAMQQAAAFAPGQVAAAPSPARALSNPALDAQAQVQQSAKKRRTPPPCGGIAWALSEVRTQLEAIVDVEGVQELMEGFPECVLLGGIAARRELVAALLGETSVASNAAAVLVAPGVRQPIALELRCGKSDFGPLQGAEAENWLRSVQQAAQQALGSRLKVDPLRLRLSAAGCANLDVVDLPEKCGPAVAIGPSTPPKVEEMRVRHLGSSANLLVCLEPGPPLDLCRRFDPTLKRTVLIGAAASAGTGRDDHLPAAVLCGPSAASALEERFAILCNERVPQWIQGLERLENRLSKSSKDAREAEHREDSDELLRKARAAGLSFGRALQEVIGGTPGCNAGALTLEEELVEFGYAAAKGQCGTGHETLTGKDAAAGAADLFAGFDGVEGYAAYLRDHVKISGAEVPLNGGAAWQRLLAEVEVAMRLAHPPKEELANITQAAMSAGGTGVHGHQRWEDVASKLMLSAAFEPLLRRVRYVAARVIWLLRHQKHAVSEWMSILSDGPGARIYSPLFSQHLNVLRNSPIVKDLVFGAYDNAVAVVGAQILKNLSGTLTAACINPEIMLRPTTQQNIGDELKQPPQSAAPTAPDAVMRPAASSGTAQEEASSAALGTTAAAGPAGAGGGGSSGSASAAPPLAAADIPKSGSSGGSSSRAKEARRRVMAEMQRRSGPSGGLPVELRDRVFDPKEAAGIVGMVTVQLKRAFRVLADILANQAFAFADAGLKDLCRRQVDEAMNTISFSMEQRRVLSDRHHELVDVARQVEDRLAAVRRCLASLRTADVRPPASLGMR
eukprot:TRINITY_DN41930_c0_g1_i1.p1 TRINITY_DN41930_c0_g1~~TRINITY_DN41930_c0_g1_i1.p1  ORF type:complete len:914 (-),score=247.43 TRINITY_DN41930_c0_g1_i1:57-2798(-)